MESNTMFKNNASYYKDISYKEAGKFEDTRFEKIHNDLRFTICLNPFEEAIIMIKM